MNEMKKRIHQHAVERHRTMFVLDEVDRERIRQDQKFGDQSGKDVAAWLAILAEEFGEAAKEVVEHVHGDATNERWRKLRTELIQTAATAVAFIEYGDRNAGWAGSLPITAAGSLADHPPLECSGYLGCWADHSVDWHRVDLDVGQDIATRFLGWVYDRCAYGSWFNMGGFVRFARAADAAAAREFLEKEMRDR